MNNNPNRRFVEKMQSNQTLTTKKKIAVLDFWVIKFVFSSYRLMIYAFLRPS